MPTRFSLPLVLLFLFPVMLGCNQTRRHRPLIRSAMSAIRYPGNIRVFW